MSYQTLKWLINTEKQVKNDQIETLYRLMKRRQEIENLPYSNYFSWLSIEEYDVKIKQIISLYPELKERYEKWKLLL